MGVEQQNAFEVLKKAFTTAPVLRIPNDEDPFKLSIDASDFATGAVLSQKDMQTNLWHPVAFFSKSLDVHERNYEIYDKKLLVTNFIWSYLHHFFDDSHGLKASLKPLRRPFDRCQSRLEAINNGRDIKQINW